MSKKAVIIGAGLGSLAASCFLAKKGYEVLVLEKNSSVGGRARVLKDKGYTFDMGPSWYLMPDVFERFFANFGKKPQDYYQLKKLDPAYRIFFEKNKVVDISSDLKKNVELFDKHEKDGGKKFLDYLAMSKTQYDLSMESFVYRDYDSVFSVLKKDFFEKGRKLNLFGNVSSEVNKYFESDFLKKILMYNIVFLGGTPKNTPSLYSIMAHIDFNLGVWYPKGGLGSVVDGIFKLSKELRVQYKYDAEVSKINGDKNLKKANSLVLSNGEIISADLIIANADYHHVEMNLIDEDFRTYDEPFWKKSTVAPSAFVAYLGINKKLKKLDHHNLFLGNDWEKYFDSIFENPEWPDKPTYYLCVPSKNDDSVAPKGKENVFITVPIASGLEDNPELRDKFFEKIIIDVEEVTGEKIFDNIEYKKFFSINDFRTDYNAYKGTALGLSHTLFQSAFFRPRMKSQKLNNLYYCGQYVHPGIGVPMALIVAEVLDSKLS